MNARVEERSAVQKTAHTAAQPTAAPGDPLLLGLIGAGIQRSLTPAMHEAEGAAQGLRLHYQLIDLDRTGQGVEALPGLLQAARTMGFAGLNITYPCKQAVMPLLDALSDEAQAMGAVNTVVFRDGRAIGHNTDGSGWRWGFERALPGADLSRVVLLGAGGAGSAIAHAVLRLGAETLVLVDSDTDRAGALTERLNTLYPGRRARFTPDVAAALAGATGLIHATPTGMDKLPGLPLPAALLRPSMWVSEIVYFPLDTALLRAARAAGCAVSDGGGMAVGQAVGAFEHFTGLQADATRMRAHFASLLHTRG
jgi:shikimate dehydrogenase